MTYLRTCLNALRAREAARASFARDPFHVPHVIVGTPIADLYAALDEHTQQIERFAEELRAMVAAPLVPVAPFTRPEARVTK